MDANYRLQRHIYDVTRRFYLLGRASLLSRLDLPTGGRVLEIGCGTAWNLIRLARLRPDLEIEGLDASAAMLETAQKNVERAGLADRIGLRCGLAEDLHDETASRPAETYDCVLFSYALSMIPGWREALVESIALVRPAGTLAVVDFGDQRGVPGWLRAILRAWLRFFHTEPRDELPALLYELAMRTGSNLLLDFLARRYAVLGLVQLPA